MRTLVFMLLISFSYFAQAQTDSTFVDFIIEEVSISKEEIYNRALVSYNTNQYSEAIKTIDSALVIDSFFVEAMYLKAISLQKEGNLQEARALFEKMKAINPDYGEVDKYLNSYYLTTYISKHWYYMLTMLLITVLIATVVAKSASYRKAH